jgi:hypothetical protein
VKAGKIINEFNYSKNPNIKYFNHVLACIPIKNDTIWAECTSQNNPLHNLGKFSGIRLGLLITKDSSRIINVTGNFKEKNKIKRTISIKLLNNSQSEISIENQYFGHQMSDRLFLTEEKDEEKIKNYLTSKYRILPEDILNFDVKLNEEQLFITEKINFKKSNTKEIGETILIKPFVETMNLYKINISSSRQKEDIVYLNPIDFDYLVEETTTIVLPNRIDLSNIENSNQLINHPLGNFSINYRLEGNQLTIKRNLEIKSGKYSLKNDQLPSELFFKKLGMNENTYLTFKKI